MPDRELPEHLTARLSNELTTGAPLAAPLPSQARYAGAGIAPAVRSSHVRLRLVAATAAATALLVVAAAAGPTPARQWIGDSVGNLSHTFGGDVRHAGASPSPEGSPASQPATVEPSPHPSAEPTESPEPQGSPEPSESPEPQQSPTPSQSPEGGGDHSSPNPSPSPDSHDGGGGSPSPTSDS